MQKPASLQSQLGTLLHLTDHDHFTAEEDKAAVVRWKADQIKGILSGAVTKDPLARMSVRSWYFCLSPTSLPRTVDRYRTTPQTSQSRKYTTQCIRLEDRTDCYSLLRLFTRAGADLRVAVDLGEKLLSAKYAKELDSRLATIAG